MTDQDTTSVIEPNSLTRLQLGRWRLYADWCASHGVHPLPADTQRLSQYLAEVPAGLPTQARRIQAIRLVHEEMRVPLVLPGSEADEAPPAEPAEDRVDLTRALAQLRPYAHRKYAPAAIRARRDGWLLVLSDHVGLTRNKARLLPSDAIILFPEMTISGVTVESGGDPQECVKCAVTRWLRIVGDVALGFRNNAAQYLSPESYSPVEHDCLIGLDGYWRNAPTLMPAVDQHGWASGSTISARAVSTILAERHRPSAVDIQIPTSVRTPSRGPVTREEISDLADAYDEADRIAAELLQRIEQMLGETDETLARIADVT